MKVHLDNINWLISSEGGDQWSHGAEFMGHYGDWMLCQQL